MKIAIVGAGLFGRLLAFSLLQAGKKNITLFDKDPLHASKSAGMTAAGMIAPFSELEKSPLLIAQIGCESLTRWPLILKQLNSNIYFRQLGSLITAHPKDHSELTHFIRQITQTCAETPYQFLKMEALQNLEPEVDANTNWYYFPEEGQIDAQALIECLAQKLEFLPYFQREIIDIHEIQKHFDLVFDCRGVGGRTYFKDLRGVRGELVWLHAPSVKLSRPIRYLHPRYSIYIVPRPNDIYIVGASEIECEDYSPISLRSLMELLSTAYNVHKGFIEARIIQTAVNCRPALSNHLPKIKYADKVIAVNGLYRHGFLLAPVLIEEILKYLANGFSEIQYPILWEKIRDYSFV